MFGRLEYWTDLVPGLFSVWPGSSCSVVAEASIWGEWIHCGTLTAVDAAELVFLDTKRFLKTMTESPFDATLYLLLRRYALLFAEIMMPTKSNDAALLPPRMTDIPMDSEVVQEKMDVICPP